MRFELLPVLDAMIHLYEQPADIKRFNNYLNILKGDSKGDYLLPIGGFNPMGKEHVLQQMLMLKEIRIEKIMVDALVQMNEGVKNLFPDLNFQVSFNLADDLKGGWTNRYSSDYQSKFRLNPLIKRKFTVPIFWTSENIDIEKIKLRTLEFCWRTVYALQHSSPKTLREHLLQELFVMNKLDLDFENSNDADLLLDFYNQNKNSEEENILFNFIYGDPAPLALGSNAMGIKADFAGYRFLKSVIANRITID